MNTNRKNSKKWYTVEIRTMANEGITKISELAQKGINNNTLNYYYDQFQRAMSYHLVSKSNQLNIPFLQEELEMITEQFEKAMNKINELTAA